MKKISLCMIVKNEEKVLARCLENAYLCFDEIVIVDTGSTDKTKEIAKKFTHKIYDFVWVDDFSKARNFAFSKAKNPLIMWLDADDILTKEEALKIKELAKNFPKNITSIRMLYNIDFDEFGNPTFSYYRERLFLKSAKPLWKEPIHEYVHCPGNTMYSDIAIIHKKEVPTLKARNLKIFNKLKKEKKPFSARMQYYYARELAYHNKPNLAIKEFKKFLKNNQGWHINKMEACLEMSDCYLMIKDESSALKILFESFLYALPTAETLCKIAQIYQNKNCLLKAVYWFELALEKATLLKEGFFKNDYNNFIPAINLCLLYYKLNNFNKAEFYNNIAGTFKPYDKSFLYNEKFFKILKLKQASRLKNKNKFKLKTLK